MRKILVVCALSLIAVVATANVKTEFVCGPFVDSQGHIEVDGPSRTIVSSPSKNPGDMGKAYQLVSISRVNGGVGPYYQDLTLVSRTGKALIFSSPSGISVNIDLHNNKARLTEDVSPNQSVAQCVVPKLEFF